MTLELLPSLVLEKPLGYLFLALAVSTRHHCNLNFAETWLGTVPDPEKQERISMNDIILYIFVNIYN